jgi:hypothetical protein
VEQQETVDSVAETKSASAFHRFPAQQSSAKERSFDLPKGLRLIQDHTGNCSDNLYNYSTGKMGVTRLVHRWA